MIFVGIDDTDMPGESGTGRLARKIAHRLSEHFSVLGVTRHQLLRDPRIPCTRKNSSKAIHITGEAELDRIFETAYNVVVEDSVEGSDPGIAVSNKKSDELVEFARKTQKSIVTMEEAFRVASKNGVRLEGVAGTRLGVVGALAAVGLAQSGNDGWFIELGGRDQNDRRSLRRLPRHLTVRELKDIGVSRVVSTEGYLLGNSEVIDSEGRVRPFMKAGEPLVVVKKVENGWRIIDPKSLIG
ncbi:MAG: ABC transporter substrate-binding protein [Candidatus Freyrarchaeum guaymaensis]